MLQMRETSEYDNERGLVLADTKFEFGITEDGEFIIIDEVLTPDSSRFSEAREVRLSTAFTRATRSRGLNGFDK